MRVNPFQDKKDPSKIVARINGIIALFEKGTKVPKAGEYLDVMITGVKYHRLPDGPFDDYTRPRFFFIRAVMENDILVKHHGFIEATIEQQRLARASYEGRCFTLTPGRVGVYIGDRRTAIPGEAFVKAHDLSQDIIRIEGVAELDQLRYVHAQKAPK